MSAVRFIKRDTTVNVVSKQITDIFTTDFRWYWINMTHEGSSATEQLNMKLLSNGTPYAGSTYQMAGRDNDADTSHSSTNQSDTTQIAQFSKISTTDDGGGQQFWIVNPAHAANTIVWVQSSNSTGNNNFMYRNNAYALEDTNIYDGIELSGTSGTVNSAGWWTVDIYGMQQT